MLSSTMTIYVLSLFSLTHWRVAAINNTTTGSIYTTASPLPIKTSENSHHEGTKETAEKLIDIGDKCNMYTDKTSIEKFQEEILRKKYEIVRFSLDFDNVIVHKEETVFRSTFVWSWAPRDSRISHQYATWPFEYGIWSFGILSSYSRTEVKSLSLNITHDCSIKQLSMGENTTDMIISKALASMSLGLEKHSVEYISSRLCYRILLSYKQDFWNYVCKNIFCPLASNIARRCFTYTTQNNIVVFEKVRIHTEDLLLGVAPTVLGWILAFYSPLLLFTVLWWIYSSYTPATYSEISEEESPDYLQQGFSINNQESSRRALPLNTQDNGASQDSDGNEEIVVLTDESPVTIMSTICKPCRACHLRRSVLISRCVRIVFIFCILSCVAVEVILDYIFVDEDIKDAVRQEQNVGFRSMLAGITESRKSFLPIFGGPYVALCLYVVTGLLILLPPKDLSNLLANGIPDGSRHCLTPLIMTIERKELLSSVCISTKIGYYKVVRFLMAQSYMVLNPKFWRYVFTFMTQRFETRLWNNDKLLSNDVSRKILSIALFIPYVFTCLCETVLMLIYYGLPIFGFTVVSIRGFVKAVLNKVHSDEKLIITLLGYMLAFLSALTAIYFILMFHTLFIDAFIFLSRILMFTYTGIIAYPKLSYGYIILAVMGLYYLVESINRFARFYLKLLKLTIAVAEGQERERVVVRARLISTVNGLKRIPKGLFEFVIEHTKPRRNLMFESFVRLVTTLIVISVSVLLITKFRVVEDLHLTIHVLFAIFVCALPIVLNSVLDKNSKVKSKMLKRRVQRAVHSYCILNFQGEEVPRP